MTPRAKTVVRGSIFAALALLALAVFVRPFERRPTHQWAQENAEPVAVPAPTPTPPQFKEHVTPEGLVAVDSRALFERMRQSRARAIVVGAWATWCGSCKVDIPVLLGLRKTFGADVDVMMVSVDESEDRPKAAQMLEGFGETNTAFVVDEPLADFKPAMHPLWPGMLPATFLFDASAKVHYFWGGPVAEKELTPLIKQYLAGENIDGHSDFALIQGGSRPSTETTGK